MRRTTLPPTSPSSTPPCFSRWKRFRSAKASTTWVFPEVVALPAARWHPRRITCLVLDDVKESYSRESESSLLPVAFFKILKFYANCFAINGTHTSSAGNLSYLLISTQLIAVSQPTARRSKIDWIRFLKSYRCCAFKRNAQAIMPFLSKMNARECSQQFRLNLCCTFHKFLCYLFHSLWETFIVPLAENCRRIHRSLRPVAVGGITADARTHRLLPQMRRNID